VADYWRHPAVPHLEIRNVEDGRRFAHGRHAHATFSIGAIMAGRSTYLNGHASREIEAGGVVVINPGVVHACNPLHDEPWAYRMFYVDSDWLASLQPRGSDAQRGFVPFADAYTDDPQVFAALDDLYGCLTASASTPALLQAATLDCFQWLAARLSPARHGPTRDPAAVIQAAEFIRRHCHQALRLEDICAEARLSPSYLIRAFKAHYGLTPHGYLIDCRLQRARDALRRGEGIADVAAQVGFADQAHLQRLFKRALATTPGQYRR
jgi:AraC-like DNA-binding protein